MVEHTRRKLYLQATERVKVEFRPDSWQAFELSVAGDLTIEEVAAERSRVQSGVYRNFHYRWIAAIMDRLNAGLLPSGMIAMAEQIIGGPEPDVVTLQQNDIAFSADGVAAATMTEAPPRRKRSL